MTQLSKLWNEVFTGCSAALEELRSGPGPKPTHNMCAFLILGEDRRNASHFGVDLIALVRSVWMTCFRGKRQGGSTIAMQLVRTITGKYQRSAWRKITEIVLAVRLSQTFDRLDIARVYLWLAYYGWNMHGFSQACEKLNLCPETATNYDVALLVARLKYPQPRSSSSAQVARIRQRACHLLALESGNVRESVSETQFHGTISNS